MQSSTKESKPKKCPNCSGFILKQNYPQMAKTLMPSIGIARNTPRWDRAQKLVAKNEKCSIYQDSFGPATWWVLLLEMPHGSPEEKQILDWVKTGNGLEPA